MPQIIFLLYVIFLKLLECYFLWKEATNLDEASNEAQRDNYDTKRREMDL